MATKKREILVRDLRVGSLVEDLPDEVFPVKLGLQLARADYRDEDLLGPPEYAFTVKESSRMPYVPGQTVWFYNPVECPDQGVDEFTFHQFAEQFREASREIKNCDPKAHERLYIGKVVLAEVPSEYLIRDNGQVGVKPDIYHDRERVAFATFDKRPKVENEDVREDLGTSLPGMTLKPLRMTELKEVTLKPHGGSSASIGQSTKSKYYTDGQVGNDPSASAGWSPSTWPDPIWDQVEQWFPKLVNSPFLREAVFDGEHMSEERFVEKSVKFVDHAGKPVAEKVR